MSLPAEKLKVTMLTGTPRASTMYLIILLSFFIGNTLDAYFSLFREFFGFFTISCFWCETKTELLSWLPKDSFYAYISFWQLEQAIHKNILQIYPSHPEATHPFSWHDFNFPKLHFVCPFDVSGNCLLFLFQFFIFLKFGEIFLEDSFQRTLSWLLMFCSFMG